jgi:lysophospholipase L1-like esterase
VNLGRRLGRVLVAGLLGLAVFATLGEILARSFDLVDRLNAFPRGLYLATDDESLPYLLRPGMDEVARGVRIVTNEHGMRGPSFSASPAPGVHRVLVVGDSVAFGFRLDLDDTFPRLLESELERRTREPWEVLNAGVEGYNSENQLALLERKGLGFAPETVVVAFNLNDYDYGPVMGPMGVLTLDRSQRVSSWSLANLSEFYLLLRWIGALVWQRTFGPAPPPLPPPDPSSPFDPFDRYVSMLRKRYYAEPTDERWPTMVASLRGMGAAARARGARLLVAILPDGDQIGVAEPDLTPQRKLEEVCASAGLECLDLRPALSAASGRGPLFMDIMHPNAEGHRVIADALADALVGERVSAAAAGAEPPSQEDAGSARGSGTRRNTVTPTR